MEYDLTSDDLWGRTSESYKRFSDDNHHTFTPILRILTDAPLETSWANFRKGHTPNFRIQPDLSNTCLVGYLIYYQIVDDVDFITDDLAFSSSPGLGC